MNTTQEISDAKKFLQNKRKIDGILFGTTLANGDTILRMSEKLFCELLVEYKKTKTKPSTFIVRNVNCHEESLECAMTEMFVPLDVIFLIEKSEEGKLFFTIENTEKNIFIANELKKRLLETGQNIEIEMP